MTPLSTSTRLFALFIAIASILATLALVIIREPIDGSEGTYLSTFWALLRFFTILTNALVSVVLIRAAKRGQWSSFSLLTGCTVWIALVGIIYHLLLAADHNPTGMAAVTNHVHHTLVPIGTFLIWLFTRQRQSIAWSKPFMWLIFPLGYNVYMLIRGHFDGLYPYEFSNPHAIGWQQFLYNQLGLLAVFLAFGFGFMWFNNLALNKRAKSTF